MWIPSVNYDPRKGPVRINDDARRAWKVLEGQRWRRGRCSEVQSEKEKGQGERKTRKSSGTQRPKICGEMGGGDAHISTTRT